MSSLESFLFCDLTIHRRSIRFLRILAHISHFHFQCACAEHDLNNIADFYLITCFCRSSIDGYPLAVARLISYGSSFDQAGYFQIFIQSH